MLHDLIEGKGKAARIAGHSHNFAKGATPNETP
jgi:hypothetical protein